MQGQTPEQQVMYGYEKAFENAASDEALSAFQKLGIMRALITDMQAYAATAFHENPNNAVLVAEYIVCFLGEHAGNSKLLSEAFESAGETTMHAMLQRDVDVLFDKYATSEDQLGFRR